MTARQLILVVDDESGMLRLIDLILTKSGFRVIVAENGMEALHLSEIRRPDLLILDINMPDMNGLEVMRRLRERSKTPVILLTGQSHEEKKILGLDAGADDYIV